MDETLTSGKVINLLAKTDLAIYFVTQGGFLEGKIEVGNGTLMTHDILTSHNGEMFQLIKQMACEN